MDERKIPEFLTACYQWGQEGEKPSPFIFEVWQVRINRHTPGEGIELQGGHDNSGQSDGDDLSASERAARDLASSAGGGGAGGGDVGLEGGEVDPNEAASGGSGLSRSEGIETRIGYDVDVEFYGIVKIYNPVNEAMLTGKTSDDTTDTDTTESADDDASPTSSNP
jgi:hypothetical protein